jgi:hypothetical protein
LRGIAVWRSDLIWPNATSAKAKVRSCSSTIPVTFCVLAGSAANLREIR